MNTLLNTIFIAVPFVGAMAVLFTEEVIEIVSDKKSCLERNEKAVSCLNDFKRCMENKKEKKLCEREAKICIEIAKLIDCSSSKKRKNY